MSPDTQTLKFQQTVKASPKVLYRAFTNPTDLTNWLANMATVSPEVGGRIYLWWNTGYYTSGEYTQIEPKDKVAFTWRGRGEPAASEVEINLSAKDGVTLVEIEHRGIGSSAEWDSIREETERGWQTGLENLASVFETGEDLRFTRRPMLGIIVEDFPEELAKELDMPVTKGIRIGDPIEGMGAKAAGLQNNDVIVGLAGKPVTDYSSLTNALQNCRAGDTIPVDFYRGAEKKRVEMKLSGRPIPEIPKSAEELARVVETKQDQMSSTLAGFFAELTEEEASHKPKPDVWSAKENLAHLIHGERGTQNQIADEIGGFTPHYDDYGGNIHERVQATLAVYPTSQDLLAEFRRSCAETVAFLARLPVEFLDEHKGAYWSVAYNQLESDFHFDGHLEQMRAAVQDAREKKSVP